MSTYNSKVIKSVQVKLVSVEAEEFSMSDKTGSGTVSKSLPPHSKSNTAEIDLLKKEFEQRLKIVGNEFYERGLSEGLKSGEDKLRKESIKGMESLQNQLKEVAALRKNIIKKSERDVLSLAISIAEKILQQEITSNQDIIQNILKAAMKNILDRDNIKVRLHPLDFHYMMDKKEDFLQGFDGIKNIVFEEDGSIIRGGAVIETQFGEVDARIDRQFKEVKDQLLSSIN